MSNVSDIFECVFDSHSSGCRHSCSCGREHFDGCEENGWTWGDGELERLRESAKESPDKVIEHYGSIGYMEIGGQDIVYGCKCHIAEKYENFIIQNAERLATYLNKRAAMLREEADAISIQKIDGDPA